MEISHEIRVRFKRNVVSVILVKNLLCEYPNRDGEVGGCWGGGRGRGRCQLGGKGGVRRCCGTEWLIVASRHPRVLVEWIKGWKKEWKPFHAFTDQSQDHVFRAIPLAPWYTGHASPCHPLLLPWLVRLLVSMSRRSNLQTLREGNAPRHAVYRSRDIEDINFRGTFYVWNKHRLKQDGGRVMRFNNSRNVRKILLVFPRVSPGLRF